MGLLWPKLCRIGLFKLNFCYFLGFTYIAPLGCGLNTFLPVAVHYGLEDGGEGSDADARPDQHRVLRAEDLRRRGAERAVDEHLKEDEKQNVNEREVSWAGSSLFARWCDSVF